MGPLPGLKLKTFPERAERWKRPREVRPERTTLADLEAQAPRRLPIAYPDGVQRPLTRGDCVDAPRPCPWVSCRHHLYLDVHPLTGHLTLNFPDLDPDEIPETCSLDVADYEGITLDQCGQALNLTRERIRQIELRLKSRVAAAARRPGSLEAALKEAHELMLEDPERPEGWPVL